MAEKMPIRVPTDWVSITQMDPKVVAAELDRLRWALEDVVDPVGHLRRYAEEQGRELDGGAAYRVGNDLAFVQGIARKALQQ